MTFQSTYKLFILFNILCAIKSSEYYYQDYEEISVNWNDYEDDISQTTPLPESKTLDLTNKYIPILNDEIFEQYENVTEIILNNNNITLIEVHTFDKFNNTLRNLILTSNNLPTFNIQPIQSLKQLNLSNNSLTILNNTEFQDLRLLQLDASSNNLTEVYCLNVATSINLSHNNISNICIFAKSIVDINLSYNNIKYVQNNTFHNLRKLERLYLSYNQIVTLQYDTFDYSLPQLSVLNLSHNMFTEFDLLHFKYIENIESLDLSYNNISTVHQYSKQLFMKYRNDPHFLRILKLYLEGNPIKNINMTNLLEICRNLNTISISFSEISCSTLLNYTSLLHFVKGPVLNEDNVNGIKCDSSLDILTNSDAIDSMLVLLNKVKAILIVLAFFFIVFVIASIIVTVKRFRANITFV